MIEITHRIVRNTCVLVLEGELMVPVIGETDLELIEVAWGQVKTILSQSNVKHVVLDFSKVSSTTSLGIGWIVRLHTHLKKSQGEVVFCRVSPSTLTLFELAQFDQVFRIFETEEKALAYLQR